MAFSMIARADEGGLAAQTLEVARHCRPARILIVDLGAAGRGECLPSRYTGLAPVVVVAPNPPPDARITWLCRGMDAVYTAEATYNDNLPAIAADLGARLVVHANPELWKEEHRGPTTQVVLPTSWEAGRIPDVQVMPMPVDRQRVPYRRRTQAQRFLFPCSPAMLDRHGEADLLAALRLVEADVTVVMAPKERPTRLRAPNVTFEYVGPRDNYWTIYDTCDALILPRRYGGLSLPLQEAAAAGMPIITLDLPPYQEAIHPDLRVAPRLLWRKQMKGGVFCGYESRPRDLARAIDRLALDPELCAAASKQSDVFAAGLDWRQWEGPWRRLLES